MDGSSVTHLILDHALRVARAKGWNVDPADVTVRFVPTYDPGAVRSARYWDVKIRIRAAANKHRPLTRDGQIAGVVRISDGSLLETLAESDDTLRARLAADGQP